MIFIFGGAYQGKLDFALERFGSGKTVFSCGDGPCSFGADIIDGYHKYVLHLLREGGDPLAVTIDALDRGDFDGKIVICEDISCGVVPVDPELRAWREAVGRCAARLASRADEVWRVFCGIGTQIK